MNRTTIIIIGVIVIVIAVAIVLWSQFGSNNAPGGSGVNAIVPVVGQTTSTYTHTPPTGDTLTIGTTQGSVTMNNFYNNARQISSDQTSVLIDQTGGYTITYYAPDSSFNILISETPFATVRAAAEAAFLQDLGISQADACKLTVMVATPYSVDPTDADQNLGLSFCGQNSFSQ